jgi:predicted lipoprotein
MNELIEALQTMIEANADFRKAAESCREDVDYYCRFEIERMDKARAKFKAALDEYIAERIEEQAPRCNHGIAQ